MAGKGKTILLVDDDTNLLVTLGDFLRYEDFDVVTAESGEQALRKLNLNQVHPDLIILDMNMPGMGGVGFLREITEESGKTRYPVLVLTARANMAEFFSNVDVQGFLAKPCDPDDLLNEVARIIFMMGGGKDLQPKDVRRYRVLIGEDDRSTTEVLAAALLRAGYEVESVSKGPEMLEKAIVGKPDVVAVKLVFAGMNGDAVARMLHEMPTTRKIPIVLYDDSDAQLPESKFTEAKIGIRKFVRTNNPKSLLEALKDVLEE